MSTVHEVRLVVFDWGGTTVDHGCLAPVAAFVETFARHGMAVSPDEVRVDMGLHKKDHLRALLRMPAVAQRWARTHGRAWTESDLESLYSDFMPLQLEAIAKHDRLVPGLLECVAELRRCGVRIGGTTGYFRTAAERVRVSAREQGFDPDCSLCADDVPAGRPAPWMMFRIMETLRIYPPCQVVKVGDTLADVEEGRNAAAWSVGVTRASSLVGASEDEFASWSEDRRQATLTSARRHLLDAGAHAVIEAVADLPGLVDDLNARLRRGERP